MKVGIITITDFDNYGNRLQCYAVYRILKSLNCNPQVIQFIKRKKNSERIFWIKYKIKRLLRYLFKKNDSRMDIFFRFTKKYIKYIEFYKVVGRNDDRFNYYVCGSDQIWNPHFAGDSFYFAGFALKGKRISYAASIGTSTIPDDKIEKYTQYMNDMKSISVREKAGADIVKQLTGLEVTVLVDPTLMLDKNDWHVISERPEYKVPPKYILTYFLGEVPEYIQVYIKDIADKNGLEVIQIEKMYPNKYWYKTGPAEFVWLIENASLLCTDSFHGSVFSVLMDIPFIVFNRVDNQTSMNSRITTLLDTLKLQDRVFNNQEATEVFKKEYDHIPAILEKEREKAINYLKKSLELD